MVLYFDVCQKWLSRSKVETKTTVIEFIIVNKAYELLIWNPLYQHSVDNKLIVGTKRTNMSCQAGGKKVPNNTSFLS